MAFEASGGALPTWPRPRFGTGAPKAAIRSKYTNFSACERVHLRDCAPPPEGGVERLVGAAARISDWHLENLGTGLGARGAATRWAQLVGSSRAREQFLTGREIGADEAVRIDPGGGRIYEPAG